MRLDTPDLAWPHTIVDTARENVAKGGLRLERDSGSLPHLLKRMQRDSPRAVLGMSSGNQ